MARPQALVTVLLLSAVALAGCTSSADGPSDFSASVPDDPMTEPFVFEAKAPGEKYVWDLGDGTQAEGKKVEHTYGFTDGVITVRLSAIRGEDVFTYAKQFTLGTGQNAPPKLQLQANTNWLTPGEPLRLSMAQSTDGDGDPILVDWYCVRAGDLKPIPANHPSHGLPGVPFGINFLATVSNDTLPDPDQTVEGDLCSSLGDLPGGFSRDVTIEGSFQELGVYWIRVVAKDPKSVAAIGEHTVFVADWKPPTGETLPVFSGTLTGGSGGTLQGAAGETTGQALDQAVHPFEVQIHNDVGSTVTFNYGSAASQDAAGIPAASYEIEQNVVATTTEEGTKPLAADRFKRGQEYRLVVTLSQGVQVEYDVTLDLVYKVDPYYIWEEPAR